MLLSCIIAFIINFSSFVINALEAINISDPFVSANVALYSEYRKGILKGDYQFTDNHHSTFKCGTKRSTLRIRFNGKTCGILQLPRYIEFDNAALGTDAAYYPIRTKK